jgi:hypothetical protein
MKHINNNMKTHKHHIIPKHAGGTDDPSNLVELTVADHAEEHRKLYEQYGRVQDKVAWLGLAKLAPYAELMYELNSERMMGDNNPMYGKPAPNRGVTRPGIGGRKKGTKWSEAEREKQAQIRSTPGYYDYTKDPVRCNKISEANKGRKGAAEGKTWFNNGDTETYCYLCPEGFVKGRKPRASTKQGLLWYNNGIVSKQFKLDTQPKGFIRGRITKK